MTERMRDIRRTDSPVSVKTQRYLASTKSATSTAASVIAPPWVRGLVPSGGMRSSPCSSVDSTMRAMVCTVTTGYSPTLVSPESITASAPSSTAFATSEVSARVGTGLWIIDSSICVATMTGLADAAGELDGVLLHDRHGLERQLHAEVAAGDHDRVERLDDLLELLDGLRLLDLRDDRTRRPTSVHDLVHALDVVGVAHERQRDEVDAELEAPAQVGLVLLGQRGHVHRDAGQVDALVVRDRAGDDDPRRDDGAVGLEDLDA